MPMTSSDIARLRLQNQRIAESQFARPGDVVAWLGAVQAQDFNGALWAVGLRMRPELSPTEALIEQAIADRQIIRTWPMRRTLHFVAAADAGWMLDLLAARIVKRLMPQMQREFELDQSVLARAETLLVRSLQGGKQLSRSALYQVLESKKIATGGGRGLHILSLLSMSKLLCFGSREGKQPTFRLFDEWVPAAKPKPTDEALAELARRYFTSHGPASLQDFTWWSGLTVAEAKAAIELAKSHLAQETAGDKTYWLAPVSNSSFQTPKDQSPATYLLPPFDEYTVAYKDRSAVLSPANANQAISGNGIFSPAIVLGGQVVGIWKRELKKDKVIISPIFFTKLSKAETRDLPAAANRYGNFLSALAVVS
ncbi:MAG TPA: winged helix DNA-binding domain-containing protein [Blastocatellia bacterium]|nr:winged helix DNA-binding domain-containing protein [Blastocatellia bacterium]